MEPEEDGALTASFNAAGAAADHLQQSIAGVGTALDGINRSVLDGGNSMNALSVSIEGVAASADHLGGVLDNLVSIIPGLGGIGNVFAGLGGIFRNIGEVVGNFVGSINEAAGVMDGFTGINREMAASLFGTAAGFGQTLSEAKLYRDLVLSMADDFATKEFGFIRLSEAKAMFEAARRSKLSMEDLTATVSAAGATMEGYAAGILQASAMGLELTEYTNLLGDAIYGQGLETREAMMQLSLFRDISGDTGVALEDVTGTLQDVSRSFRTLGIQADFGEPVLRGFAASLTDIGLGAENAGTLTKNLMSSIADIAQDPALAYITSKFGDLGYGAGGSALSASVDMQADILRAEKTGDQSAIGMQLATAMRDTLMQASGRQDIVTVFDAEGDSSLAQANYQQQKLLEGMFNLDANSSQRTLEMLSQLEEATRTGNTELATELATDLAEGKNVRNETRGWQDAMAAKVDGIAAELAVQTGSLFNVAHHLGLLSIDELGTDITRGVDTALSGVSAKNSAAAATSANLTSGALSDEDLRAIIEREKAARAFQEGMLNRHGPGGAGTGTGIGSGLGSVTLDTSSMDPSFQTMISKLTSIDTAISEMAKAMSSGLRIPGAAGRNN